MKYKNILKVSLAALLGIVTLSGCVNNEWNEITELNLARCLVPGNLAARVDASKGDVVTFDWSLNKDAGGYELAVYTDEALTQLEDSWPIKPGEVPYTTRLTADKEYWFTVQAYRVDADGFKVPGTESKVSLYDGSFKTYAVKDNLFLEVKGRTTSSVSLAWSQDVDDFTEVTELRAVPVKGGNTVKKVLSDAEAGAAAATIDGLEPSTEYQITLFYMSASRGTVDTWTKAEQGSAVTITTSDELKTAVAAGGNYYLPYNEAGYSMSTAKPAGDLTLIGELSADGERTPVSGSIDISSVLENGSSIRLENLKFADNASISHLIVFSDDANAVTVDKIEVVNCEISGYKAGLFSLNKKGGLTVNEITFDSCDIFNIVGDGGDGFDVRQPCDIKLVKFVNNTIYDGFRTFVRLDQVDGIKIGTFDIENNTIKNIATMDNGNNRAFFSPYIQTNLILKKNVFLYEDGGKTAETDVDRAQLIHDNARTIDPNVTASDNYAFAYGKDFFKRMSPAALGVKTMNVDPCYNSKGNFFQLAAQDLIEAKVGASKWWIQYVEKPEDLTQHVITGAHTWNLQNATLFAGDVKNSRVRDELMLVGTEATPLNADGGITFKKASVLTRKGVPTEGYASFKVNAPGSVDMLLSDPGKTGASVVVALYDDNGLTVQGSVGVSGANPEVQKIVIPEVSGEGTVYLYSTGAVTITKLGWSEDTLALDKVLETPKPAVEPVTLTEGDETAVTVNWEPVHGADHYVVVFNKRTQDPQTETSFTVPAEDIAALKAGLYTFTVQAFPAASDLYYQTSEKGNASFAIQPKGGGGEQVEVTLTWDFSDADWVAAFESNFSKINNNEDVTFSLNGLTVKGGATLKYNKTADNVYFIQMGGSGAADKRALQFEAPDAGTLKVWVSNSGDSDALDRMVTVALNGEVLDSQVGGYAKKNGPHELEFAVTGAGSVSVYPSAGLCFYKVEFTYMSGAPAVVEYDWNFTDADWVAAFESNFSKINNNEDVTFTVNGLTVKGGATLKYNKTSDDVYFIQMGGGGAADKRALTFEAPSAGTVKVWASNSGDSDALDRMVVVALDGAELDRQVGGYAKKNGPHELEFAVSGPGVVSVYPSAGLCFYHIYYTNQ